MNDTPYVIYARNKGFLTEANTWSIDIVDAELFDEDNAHDAVSAFIAYNPIIFKWM